jgi:hypothetical protein
MGEAEPPLVFAGGLALWPVNGSAGLFRAPYQRTVAKLPVHDRSGTELREYPSVPAALSAVGREFSTAEDGVAFLATTSGDEWTALFAANFPHSEVAGYWFARARIDVGCDYLGYQWTPSSPASVAPADRVLGNASFLDYRYVRKPLIGRQPPPDKRSIQASDQGGRWEFDLVGQPRPYELPEYYERRRKAERLPLELIETYLSACGIPVRQADWLRGPVTVVVQRGRGIRRGWGSPEELRSRVGYPAQAIPASLTGWSAHG